MNIEVRRRVKTSEYTIGDLYIGDKLFCQTMEDTDRGLMFQSPLQEILAKKIYGKTAIPTGVYEMVFNYSDKFKKELPLLLNVPGFNGIRIHSGNTEADSLGCILPGKESGRSVINSRDTCRRLFPILRAASKKEKIFVFVTSYDA